MILQNIWKGVIGNALINISPEILSQLCFSLIGFIKTIMLFWVALSIDGLSQSCL